MDKTLSRSTGSHQGPNSILKSIIKIEGFQLTDKRTIKCKRGRMAFVAYRWMALRFRWFLGCWFRHWIVLRSCRGWSILQPAAVQCSSIIQRTAG